MRGLVRRWPSTTVWLFIIFVIVLMDFIVNVISL